MKRLRVSSIFAAALSVLTVGALTLTASSAATPKTEWKIAVLGTLSGSEAPAYTGCNLAEQAWTASVNAKGGINGHLVRLYSENDQGSGPIALTQVKTLWTVDHINAIVGSCTNDDAAWMPYAIQHGIPVIGGQADNAYWGESKYVFPDAVGYPSFNYSVAEGAKVAGVTKFGVAYCEEAPACAEGVPFIKAAAATIGEDMVWSGEVAGVDPSFTAQCLSAQQAGAQAILVEGVAGVFPRFIQDCTAQNYKPYYLSSGFSTTPDLASNPGLQNQMIGIMLTFPWVQDNTPATKAFHEAMTKYGNTGNVAANSPATSDGWLSAQIFEYAASRVKGNPSTGALLHSMWTNIKKQTFGGLAPPTTYTNKPNPPTKCFYFVGIQNDKYTTPWGDGYKCQP
jgi:branched-chain amino acid transport system substrate-binding protein